MLQHADNVARPEKSASGFFVSNCFTPPLPPPAKTEALRLTGLVSGVIAQAKRPRKKAERNPPLGSMLWSLLRWCLQNSKPRAYRCAGAFCFKPPKARCNRARYRQACSSAASPERNANPHPRCMKASAFSPRATARIPPHRGRAACARADPLCHHKRRS
jgi:hypothetical protein